MLDIPKIRAILDEAIRWDMDFDRSHTHLLNPVLPLEELAAWEDLTEVTLPEDYRTCLTQLGKGGAGPNYGLYPPSLCPVTRPPSFSAAPASTARTRRRNFRT